MKIINKSKSYILPLLDDYVKLKHVREVNNCYLFLEGDENKYIIIEYKKNNLEDYLIELRNNQYFIDIVEKEDFYIILFKVPDGIKEDYNKFIEGKFSKIYNKDKIIKFLMTHYSSSEFKAIQRIKQVLYRDRALKEELEYTLDVLIPENAELSSIPSK